VAGHNHFGIERDDVFAGGDPVFDRAVPHDRMPFVEQQIPGEDHALLRQPGDRVGGGMRRAKVDQLDRGIADAQLQRFSKVRLGMATGSVAPVELAAHGFVKKGPGIAHRLPVIGQAGQIGPDRTRPSRARFRPSR
jgi:hypothetical protein